MFCSKCGKEIKEGHKFCIYCGEPVQIAEQENIQDSITPLQDESTDRKPEKKKKKKIGKVLAIAGVIVVLLVLAAGGVLTYVNKDLKTQYDKLAADIESYGIKPYIEEKDGIYEKWEDSNIFHISDKKDWIKVLEDIKKNAEHDDAELADQLTKLTALMDQKEMYHLNDTFETYDDALQECDLAIKDKDLGKAKDKLEQAADVLKNVIEENDNYIAQKQAEYQAINLRTAEVSDVSSFNENMEKLNTLAEQKKYSSMQDVFTELDRIEYQYIEPETYLNVNVQQLDATEFPNVKLYVQLEDTMTGDVPENLDQTLFFVRKRNANGEYIKQAVTKVSQLNQLEALKVNMVADVSGSMDGSPLYEAKSIMRNFVKSVQFQAGDMIELISFSTGVYLIDEFTNDVNRLMNDIDGLYTSDMTSLYDALYTAVVKTASQSGAKCVIAFTDGIDNYSSNSIDDVISIAQRYHVPIFIICIGDSYTNDVAYLAQQTGGNCYDAGDISSMQNIYNEIYRQQKELYMVEFTDDAGSIRESADVVVGYHSKEYGGESNYNYTPNLLLDVTGATLYQDGPEAVVEGYMKAFDDAVTNSDFSQISPFLKKDSNIYKTQKKYVQRDIQEELDSYEIVDVVYSDAKHCVVTTLETYLVQVSGQPLHLMTQKCKYNVVNEKGQWWMTDFADRIEVISRVNQ